MTESWLKLYRKLTQWEWYTNSHMVHLYLHLLLTANVSDKAFQGETIRRGQLLTSRNLLAQQTGMSEATVRRCLQRLCQTGEICIKATSRGTVITICKYDVYQYRDPADRPTDDPLLKNNRNILTPRTHAYDDSFPLKGDESGPLPPHRYGISLPSPGRGRGWACGVGSPLHRGHCRQPAHDGADVHEPAHHPGGIRQPAAGVCRRDEGAGRDPHR